ncbi:hypothetical protein AVEN_24775-1 [Araneus ventricosus]|uniref:Uncharacterized protein n=1 Tax=Araneus ventricosus TaxID=182803 RepID=A0A4Y2SPX4_ARAVE|nr:hypothetical protein AVEN_24775-1 [Araneus ventricosus]
MKRWLGGQNFATDNELQTSLQNWLKTQAAAFYDEGIGKLVPRYGRCIRGLFWYPRLGWEMSLFPLLTCGKSDVFQPNRGYQHRPVNRNGDYVEK